MMPVLQIYPRVIGLCSTLDTIVRCASLNIMWPEVRCHDFKVQNSDSFRVVVSFPSQQYSLQRESGLSSLGEDEDEWHHSSDSQ